MDVGELVRLLRRRWVVVVPAFILTIIVTGAAYKLLPATYQSQQQMTMLPPPRISSEIGNYGNPFLAFNSNLTVDVDLLIRNVTSDASARELSQRGLTGPYTAAFAPNAEGPFMLLTASGSQPAQVAHSIQVLAAFTEQRWRDMQLAASAPLPSISGIAPIAPPSTPSTVKKKKIELIAGIAIGGIVLTILLGVIVDARVRRRYGQDLPEPGPRWSESPPREAAIPESRPRSAKPATRDAPMPSDEAPMPESRPRLVKRQPRDAPMRIDEAPMQ
jgi:hypothetical protein